MTSVEKRRSGRKSGKHRKHSDASSSGSFLDDTDREVSSLTDRAFRSLCIGDEAIYNDSDLCTSSPCSQRDVQRAWGQSVPHGVIENREELKRAAHENFSLRMQQYGQDLIHGGMYSAQVHGEPQWEVYGERTQVSATFQQSLVETSQQEESLGEKQLLFLSNGAKELSVQQRRSRSRVSSLIQAFNSEVYTDGGEMDGKLRERNDETAWDRAALMSMPRDLSVYQQNHFGGHFPPGSAYSSRDATVYSAMSHVNCEASFMRSSHSKHSVAAQANSNFFMHSEFSPFKVWKDHNRFPFQQGEVSGFMQRSDFNKWYETPMYKSISLESNTQGQYRFDEGGLRHARNNLAPAIPALPLRSTSTSMMPPALTVEKRCESELAVQYPHRKRTESLRGNRFPSQRPSTASPTAEMSRRVQDTISSVKALQHKIKMMSEQNRTTSMPVNNLDVLQGNNVLFPYGSSAISAGPAGGNTHTTTFNTGQVCAPLVYPHHDTETLSAQQQPRAVSPELVEHAPVRAESRGATPDVRMSSYRSRATSLLFNLKDNRKRVKSTYSPTKFKGSEAAEKTRQYSTANEPLDTVIDIPYCSDTISQFPQAEEFSRTQSVSNQHASQYTVHRTGFPQMAVYSQPAMDHIGYPESTTDHYHAALTQSEMVDYSGYAGFMPENCPSNQLANGQNLQEDLSSFTPYRQGITDQVPVSDAHTAKARHTAREMARFSSENNPTGEYLVSRASAKQQFNETAGKELTRVDKYQALQENRHYYSNVSSQDRWRQTNNQDTENISLKAATTPWKQETLKGDTDQVEAYQKEAAVKNEPNLRSDKYRAEDQPSQSTGQQKAVLKQSVNDQTSSSKNAGLVNCNSLNQLPQYVPLGNNAVETPVFYGQQLSTVFEDTYTAQNSRNNRQDKMTSNNQAKSGQRLDQEPGKQPNIHLKEEWTLLAPETGQPRSIPRGNEMQSLQPTEGKPLFKSNMQKTSPFSPEDAQTSMGAKQIESTQFVEVKGSDSREPIKEQHTQAELARPHNKAQVELPSATSDRLILAEQASSEKVKAEHTNVEPVEFEKVDQDKTEIIKNKRTKEEPAQQLGQAIVQLNTEESMAHQAAAEGKNISEETGFKHEREAQGEQVKAEPARAERLKEEHIKSELVETEQTKIKHDKSKEAGAEKIRLEQVVEELVRKHDEKLDLVKPDHSELKRKQNKEEEMREQKPQYKQKENNNIRNEQNVKDDKKQAEQKNKELIEKQQVMSVNKQETCENPAEAQTVKHVKNEPDKVEQVKTELAKAKAELVKIKEKLRGDHRDSSIIPAKVEKNKNDVRSSKNVTISKEEQPMPKYQQRQDSVAVSRQSVTQADRGGDDYERLREKYGFTDYTSTNRQRLSAERKASSNNSDETQTPSENSVETVKADKSKPKDDPENTSSAATRKNTKDVGILKTNEVKDSHDGCSDSSKEFKLSHVHYSSTVAKSGNTDSGSDKVKKGNSENVEKCNPPKQIDISKQRDLDQAKSLNAERKSKLSEHTAATSTDQHIAPSRPLTHKERAQTKQEILTSKIKAHAEKEISAIKGSAIRDGLISKNFIKPFAGSQRPEVQMPPVQKASNKQENTIPSKMIPNLQMEAVKSVSPQTSVAMPFKPTEITSQMKTKTKVPTPAREENGIGMTSIKTQEALVENHIKEKASELKQTEEATQSKQENCTKNTSHHIGNESSVQSPQKIEVSKNMQGKNEPVNEDSEPSLQLVFGQTDTGVSDDSLQIMGIMVTVRERKQSLDNNLSIQEQINPKRQDGNSPLANSLLQLGQEEESSTDATTIKDEPTDAQSICHLQESSAQVTRQNADFWTDHQVLVKQDKVRQDVVKIITEEASSQNTFNSENSLAKSAQCARVTAHLAIKDDTESTMKLKTTVAINPSSHSSISFKDSPAVERRRDDQVKTNLNPPHQIVESKNTDMSPRLQHKNTRREENLEEQCVHIDNIAIRVVQTVTKEDKKMVEDLSDVAGDGGNKQAATCDLVEKESEDITKNLTLTCNESSRNNIPKEITMNRDDTAGKKEKLESKLQQMEESYFHVQSAEEANKQAQTSVKIGDRLDVSAVEDPTLSNNELCNESCCENKVFGLDQSEHKRLDSTSVPLKKDILEGDIVKTQQIKADSPAERQCNSGEKIHVDQSVHVTKLQLENQPASFAKERQRNQLTTRQNMFQEKSEVKTRTKERTSTIPEISAIADYARLKVIVSDDRDNTIQELPPNKKEGFFPLIQSRHSRRPAYTADSHTLSVKEEKSLPKKTEVSSKVNKEPKPLAFPITEKEHQRTGMFKLGDKEKQEKIKNEKAPDFWSKRVEHFQEGNKPTSIFQSNIPSVQTTNSSSANQIEQTFASQAKQVDKSDPNEKIAEVISYDEGMPYLDQISKPLMHDVGENKELTPGKNDNIHNEQNHMEINNPEKEDRTSTQQAETETNIKIKQMLEESRASLAEEARRATQREVERRAQEREAIANQIKERRQRQREAEKKAEEEKIAKQKEEETKNIIEEERLARQREEEDMQKIEESTRKKQQQQEVDVRKRQLQSAEKEQERRADQGKQQRGQSPDQQNRRVAVVGSQWAVAHREEQRRVVSQDELQKRATQEGELKTRATLEGQRRTAQDKWQREAVQAEQQRRAVAAQQQREAAQEEEHKRDALREKGRQRIVAQEEEVLKKAAQEEMERRKASQDMEQLRRAAEIQEQQLRLAAQQEQQRRAAREEEQKRRAVVEEQQRRAAREEQLRRAAQEEVKLKRAAQEEEQRRKATNEEQLRKATQKEQQRAAWEEEQKRRAADEEELRRTAQKEEQRQRFALEEQQKKDEQQRMLVTKEQQRKAMQEKEIQIKATQKEDQMRKATQNEKLKRAAQEEELRKRSAEEEKLMREDQQRRVALIEEQQKRPAQGEQQRSSAWTEAKHQTNIDVEEKNKTNQRGEGSIQNLEDRLTRDSKMKADQQTEEQRHMRPSGETRIKTNRDEENRRSVQKETDICKQREGIKTNKTPGFAEQKQVMQAEGDMAQELVLIQREEEMKTKLREEDKERTAVHRTKEQMRAAQMVDALQYYTIASESDRKGRVRQRHSSPPPTRRTSSTVLEGPEDPHQKPSRPSAPASPAIPLPRSNTSSPAVGSKPSMFLVKDNTSRGSSFLKSVKPRFHKNFGEDFRVGSPVWSETGEEEQEAMRQRATTPLYQDTGPNRLAAIRESSTLQPWHDTTVPLPHHQHHQHRPFSRRSLALDEDDSRSVVSYMSEDVESFTTSAADLSDIRSLYDYERPESSCSFSSDVCRSMGKPPAVPPKSEKALRRAKRLTTRRIKKELSRAVEDGTVGVEKPPQEDSRTPSSSGTEVHSPGRCAVATPHFSSPVSLAHTPKGESALLLSRAERQPPLSSEFAAPYPADSVTLPAAAVSLPVASPAAIATAAAAPKIVADVPPSPTLHRTSHPAPVTKYHVESCYPGSYPVTQRKVLQDVGSGQYFVVDVPVPVKTKTFIDPQTGKYVQLNVRESTERGSQAQKTYLQPLPSVAPQQQPISQDFPAGKNLELYQGYNGYPASVNSGPHNKQSIPVTPYQNQQPDRGSRTYRHPASERVQHTEGHYGSPERTPYMDTVNAAHKAHNSVSSAHSQYESFSEFDTNSHHPARSSAFSNVNSGPSQCQPREIKTMSELEDFMELSDW